MDLRPNGDERPEEATPPDRRNAAEAALIDQTLAGDPEAFGELVCRYQDRLYNTMAHLLGSADDARDVVQDAFVQAFVKLETFQRAAAFYTWLYRIAFNQAMGRYRRRRPSVSLDEVKQSSGEEPAAEGEPCGPLESSENVAQVRVALGRLNHDHRTILVLREMEGCRYEELAEILDLPVGTVRSRLHRARVQLREHLAPVYEQQLK